MSENIKFSFVMPAYNVDKYITFAIESIIKQSYSNWELIIVDDGSTDNTSKICTKYSLKDSRIKYFLQEHCGSGGKTRYEAIKKSDGEYCQILDADDWISEDILQKIYDNIEKNKSDIIISDAIITDFEGNTIREILPPSNNYSAILKGEEGFELTLNGWKTNGWFCFSKKLIDKIEYYTDNLINNDEFATRKLLFVADRIGFANGKYFYRGNPTSTTAKKNPVRPYHYGKTAYNIYKYTVDNKMKIENQRKAFYDFYKSYKTNEEFKKDNINLCSSTEEKSFIINTQKKLYSKLKLSYIYPLKNESKYDMAFVFLRIIFFYSYTLFSAGLYCLRKIYKK